jgi:hypothetical protein
VVKKTQKPKVLLRACIDYAERKACAAKLNFFEIFKQRTNCSEEEVRKNVRVI